ncbi:decaprenyl-phosphate phosphoribosyltransferase [Chloroflexi bacterium TSY]|nr:decaprenyl-phosphate phosphoribosyltransferase [Chloroflexi bacterium TSY]
MFDTRTNLYGLIRTMRIHQWTKNIFVYAALVFDGKLLAFDLFIQTTLVTVCFCLAASSVYLMNDLVDIEKDRQHPQKRFRALPSGQLHPNLAIVGAVLFSLTSVFLSIWLNPSAGIVILSYLLLNIAYSFYLKNIAIIDVMMIAAFFLLRVFAGVLIVEVENFSPWLYVCVALLALFLGFGKRRHEITLLEDGAGKHRTSLQHYNLPLLDQIISIVTSITLITYTLYSFDAETAVASEGRMLFTVPFILYIILRYLYLIHVEKKGGAPDELVLKDPHLLITSILWIVTVILLIYGAGSEQGMS